MERTAEDKLAAAVSAATQYLPGACMSRLLKAIALVKAGKVDRRGTATYFVVGASQVYRVSGGCECPDAKYRVLSIHGRPACKHQIAVWLYRKMHQTAGGQER